MKLFIALVIILSWASLNLLFGEAGSIAQRYISAFAVGWLAYDVAKIIVGEY